MSNENSSSNLRPWIDPEMEARIVALVLGEASDFEREELARLISEDRDLADYRRRIESVHGLVENIAKSTATEESTTNDDLQLPAAMQAELLAVFESEKTGEKTEPGTETSDSDEIPEPTLSQAESEKSATIVRLPFSRRLRNGLAVAALAVGMAVIGAMMVPRASYDRVSQRDSAAPAIDSVPMIGRMFSNHYETESTSDGERDFRLAETTTLASVSSPEPAPSAADANRRAREVLSSMGSEATFAYAESLEHEQDKWFDSGATRPSLSRLNNLGDATVLAGVPGANDAVAFEDFSIAEGETTRFDGTVQMGASPDATGSSSYEAARATVALSDGRKRSYFLKGHGGRESTPAPASDITSDFSTVAKGKASQDPASANIDVNLTDAVAMTTDNGTPEIQIGHGGHSGTARQIPLAADIKVESTAGNAHPSSGLRRYTHMGHGGYDTTDVGVRLNSEPEVVEFDGFINYRTSSKPSQGQESNTDGNQNNVAIGHGGTWYFDNIVAPTGDITVAAGTNVEVNPSGGWNGHTSHGDHTSEGGTDAHGGSIDSTLDIDNADFMNGGDDVFLGRQAKGVEAAPKSPAADTGQVPLPALAQNNAGLTDQLRRSRSEAEMPANESLVEQRLPENFSKKKKLTVPAPTGHILGAEQLGTGGDIQVSQSGEAKISVRGSRLAEADKSLTDNMEGIPSADNEIESTDDVYAAAINNPGLIRSSGEEKTGGRAVLSAPNADGTTGGRVVNTGKIRANNADGGGGFIMADTGVSGGVLSIDGALHASGVGDTPGGTVVVLGEEIGMSETTSIRAKKDSAVSANGSSSEQENLQTKSTPSNHLGYSNFRTKAERGLHMGHGQETPIQLQEQREKELVREQLEGTDIEQLKQEMAERATEIQEEQVAIASLRGRVTAAEQQASKKTRTLQTTREGSAATIGSADETTKIRAAAGSRVSANGRSGVGGAVVIAGTADSVIGLDGTIDAMGGTTGGLISVAGGDVSVGATGVIDASGSVDGAFISIGGGNGTATVNGSINANGGTNDSVTSINSAGDTVIAGGANISATGATRNAGEINVAGKEVSMRFGNAVIDASGGSGGGNINIGGEFQGNPPKTSGESRQNWDTPRAGGDIDRDLGRFQPAQRERQRYEEHPATAARPPTLFDENKEQPDTAEPLADEQMGEVLSLVPRVVGGGSADAKSAGLGSVDIDGNSKTDDQVVRREILNNPGELYDVAKMEKARSFSHRAKSDGKKLGTNQFGLIAQDSDDRLDLLAVENRDDVHITTKFVEPPAEGMESFDWLLKQRGTDSTDADFDLEEITDNLSTLAAATEPLELQERYLREQIVLDSKMSPITAGNRRGDFALSDDSIDGLIASSAGTASFKQAPGQTLWMEQANDETAKSNANATWASPGAGNDASTTADTNTVWFSQPSNSTMAADLATFKDTGWTNYSPSTPASASGSTDPSGNFVGDVVVPNRSAPPHLWGASTTDSATTREFIHPAEYDPPEIPNLFFSGVANPSAETTALARASAPNTSLSTVVSDPSGTAHLVDALPPVMQPELRFASIKVQEPKKAPVPDGLAETATADEPFSTFSLHVSDVSFTLAKTALEKGEWPDTERIRVEEFVNAFDYGDPLPSLADKVACQMEQTIHPFLQQRNLLRLSMRTAAAGRSQATPLHLTLVLDHSGSMERHDRQQTIQRAFAQLAGQLTKNDTVTVVGFARQPRLLVDRASGDSRDLLLATASETPSEGGTHLESALDLAFEKAREQSSQNTQAQNRVILITDGAANLGDADPERLAEKVHAMREAGIAFDAAGIGADGLNDEILEALTRKGDGRYYLLDQPEDADEGFARQIAGALRPAAKNVKVQIEFNPERVASYKLLGFEKHRLKKEDFRNDKVDAAEIAAEEAGVAIYQFEPLADGQGDVGTAFLRFRDMSSGQMVEKRWPITYAPDAPRPDQASPKIRLATVAALFAAKLKGDALGTSVDLAELTQLLDSLPEQLRNLERVKELHGMIEKARNLDTQ